MTSKEKELIKIIKTIPDFEDDLTHELFELTKGLKKQGFLNKEVAIKILKWKSPRPLKHYQKNFDKDFKQTTEIAFQQKDDKLKIHILTALSGVSYPAASAMLMFYDRTKFPIIDIRVWKQLYKFGLVTENARGLGFSLSQWESYLGVIRNLANQTNLTVRQVEKRLFDLDRKTQKGNLY